MSLHNLFMQNDIPKVNLSNAVSHEKRTHKIYWVSLYLSLRIYCLTLFARLSSPILCLFRSLSLCPGVLLRRPFVPPPSATPRPLYRPQVPAASRPRPIAAGHRPIAQYPQLTKRRSLSKIGFTRLSMFFPPFSDSFYVKRKVYKKGKLKHTYIIRHTRHTNVQSIPLMLASLREISYVQYIKRLPNG